MYYSAMFLFINQLDLGLKFQINPKFLLLLFNFSSGYFHLKINHSHSFKIYILKLIQILPPQDSLQQHSLFFKFSTHKFNQFFLNHQTMTQSSKQQLTPTWKVNLTQRFDQFYQKKPSTQPKLILTFEDELQQQLNFIPFHREQLSSSKKIHLSKNNFIPTMKKQQPVSQVKISTKNQTENKIHKSQPQNNTKEKIGKLNFDSIKKENQVSKAQQVDIGIFSLLTDTKTAKLLSRYFKGRQCIELKQLIEVCLIQYFREQEFSSEIRELLVNECRPMLCTTEQKMISLNALELMTKKTSLKLIIAQKILDIKYNIRKQALQKQYEVILLQIISQQQSIKNEEQKLEKKTIKIQLHEKELLKKEKHIKIQEKELLEKEKHARKILEEKYIKLTENLSQQFEKYYKELEKKSSAIERNARNKIQLIQKRLHTQNIQLTHQNLPQKDINQETLTKKHNNQLYLLKNKLRKTQKDLENLVLEKSQQFQLLEKQSSNLLKANTLLECKLEKSKLKVKDLSQILAKNALDLENAKRQLQLKTQRIQHLENRLLQLEHQHASIQSSASGHKKTNIQKTKKQLKQTSNQQSQCINQNQQQCLNCHMVISKINNIFKLINSGFQNHCHKSSLENNKCTLLKFEEILINESQDIILQFTEILWKSMQSKIYQINGVIDFMLKLFLARFSFLRFHSINDESSQTDFIQSMIQKISQNLTNKEKDKDKTTPIENQLKTYSLFLANYEQTQSPSNILSFCLILSVIGIDQIFNLNQNKLQYIIKKISHILCCQIQKQYLNKNQNIKVIKKLEDEELMTYLFWKYLSFSTSIKEVSIFVDILVEFCNFYSLDVGVTSVSPLFQSFFALQNYKQLINFLLIKFNEKECKNQQLREIFEKISILLQRFFYVYKQNLSIEDKDIKRLKKLLKEIQKNNSMQNSLFKANMQSIVEALSQSIQ